MEQFEDRVLLNIGPVNPRDDAIWQRTMQQAITSAADLTRYSSDALNKVQRWVVGLNDANVNQAALSAGMGAENRGAAGSLSNSYVWQFGPGTTWQQAAEKLKGAQGVQYFFPVFNDELKRMAVPNDPLFVDQWHLLNTGQNGAPAGCDANVTPVWDTYRGDGVIVAIVDDGLQSDHPDLVGNYRADLSWDFNNNDPDPTPGAADVDDNHGTSVAGVTAGDGFNGVGVSGSAPGAQLAGLRILSSPQSSDRMAAALRHRLDEIDVYNNSWGYTFALVNNPLAMDAIHDGITMGRNGLGSIYLFAAGNELEEGRDTNDSQLTASRYTIAVAAIGPDGKQSWYSNPGASVLVSGYSNNMYNGRHVGITTTDRTGDAGYNAAGATDGDPLADVNYTSQFGGTSSATPLVSGVVALILQANPNLGWRDVQAILARSATKNDPTDSDWVTNAAGYHVNHKYGFGAVNADAAVKLAKTWTNLGTEIALSGYRAGLNLPIPDNNATGVSSTITLGGKITSIERVEVVLDVAHRSAADLEVILRSPSGTESRLVQSGGSFFWGDYSNWSMTTTHNMGESSYGDWTLTVRDRSTGVTGQLNSWELRAYGTETVTDPPELVAVIPNTGSVINDGDLVRIGPRELTFRFSKDQVIDPATLAAIQIVRSGGDGVFGSGGAQADATVPIGWVGIGEKPNEVIVRFAEALPDDTYQITIVGSGLTPLTNIQRKPFHNGRDLTIRFDLDLAPQVAAVVPQPVSRVEIAAPFFDVVGGALLEGKTFSMTVGARTVTYEFTTSGNAHGTNIAIPITTTDLPDVVAAKIATAMNLTPDLGAVAVASGARVTAAANGAIPKVDVGTTGFTLVASRLTQRANEIEVYFNQDTLDPDSARNVAFYALIWTNNPADSKDDVVLQPTAVTYSAEKNKAVLTFAKNLDEYGPTPGTPSIGAFRLRIGDEYRPFTVQTLPVGIDPGSTFAGAFGDASLRFGASPATYIVSQEIIPFARPIWWPGGSDEPGHRLLPVQPKPIAGENHIGGPDNPGEIRTQAYNFQDNYGAVNGISQHNVITEAQKQRVREVFEYFNRYLGIQFLETADQGWTIATGDLRVFDPQVPTGPGGVGGMAGGGRAVMDAGEDWGNSEPGGGYFRTALHEIGHLLGLLHSYDMPSYTTMGSSNLIYVDSGIGASTESYFPGEADVVHGQAILPPLNNDVDVYKFTVAEAGVFSAETVAQRLANASLLNTSITLYNERHEVVARNDDYFSSDSFLSVSLEPGVYYIAVTAARASAPDPDGQDTSMGGTTQGKYDLRLSLEPKRTAGIKDADYEKTLLDGDADGVPGGEYNYWFNVQNATRNINGEETATTIFVDKAPPERSGPLGSLTNPYATIAEAVAAASALQAAAAATTPPTALGPVIIRVLPNGGADGDIATTADNVPYEIGRSSLGLPLADGTSLEVPRGVTLMIDAGAIVKLRASNIDIGSSTASADRSLGALQVLGTPESRVYFTSYRDETLGKSSDPLATTPAAGDWGGLVFRNNIDYDAASADPTRRILESAGIFLNYVNGAEIRYGGGEVIVDGVRGVYSPIHMLEARPTVANNRIRFSADAAMAADPNSFLESRFGDSEYTADYDRVGPHIRGNYVADNTINGLFVRVRTQAGQTIDKLEVAGRFDDLDITHVLAENIVIAGSPGGAYQAPGTCQLQQNENLLTNVKAGRDIRDGEYFGLSDGVTTVFFEFDRHANAGLVTPGRVRLAVKITDSIDVIAQRITDAVNLARTKYGLNVSAARGAYGQVQLTAPFVRTYGVGRVEGRTHGRLAIDPGIIVKTDGARIEVEMGAQLIAEGTAEYPIIFTSMRDSDYGAGGTFNTNNNSTANSPAPGNWSGIYFAPLSSGSIDYARIRYAGGTSAVEGAFAGFNPIEVHQADLRLAHSILERNMMQAAGDRNGRGFATPAAVFVQASQPVLAGNIFRDNTAAAGGGQGAAISIDANSLKSAVQRDYGRSTGFVGAFKQYDANHGPLVRENLMSNNALNGMLVRGGLVVCESIWDDTDIVHVVTDEIRIGNHHTFSGLRLESNAAQSLVVKLYGQNAGFTASGTPADIDDRIGGTLQIVGMPGHPVFLTSLRDDAVGAGFQPNGMPLTDTDNASLRAAAGDWRSVRLAEYSNDRNVAVIVEAETTAGNVTDSNATTNTAQNLGRLATTLQGGDDVLRLGFQVHGVIRNDIGGDIDVYSFNAMPGQEVWFDIDRTAYALDSVLELTDAAGNVIAWSNDSPSEYAGWAETIAGHGAARPMAPDRGAAQLTGDRRDFYSQNLRDSGMRVVLPGSTTERQTYFLRVRSALKGIEAVPGSMLADGQTFMLSDPDGTHAPVVFEFENLAYGNGVTRGRIAVPFSVTDSAKDVAGRIVNAIAGWTPSAVSGWLKNAYTFRVVDQTVVTTPVVASANPLTFGRLTSKLNAVNTSGEYQLQVRLRETQEHAGSTVRYSNISYAVNGVELRGLPTNSPLLGESSDIELRNNNGDNNSFLTAQSLGNMLKSGSERLTVGGSLNAALDVDWYTFTLDVEGIQRITGSTPGGGASAWPITFDIDYADGLARADLVLYVFDDTGHLVLIGDDSNIADDQPAPGRGSNLDDLTRGSVAKLDPYIGSTYLTTGTSGGAASKRYYVAVANKSQIPQTLLATPGLRREPIGSTQRIAEDHVGRQGGNGIATNPRNNLFTGETAQELNLHADAFTLGDVGLYVNTGGDIYAVNPFTGAVQFDVSATGQMWAAGGCNDLAMRQDGNLYTVGNGPRGYVRISTENAQTTPAATGIKFVRVVNNALTNPSNELDWQAMAFTSNTQSGSGATNQKIYVVGNLEGGRTDNFLYILNSDGSCYNPNGADDGANKLYQPAGAPAPLSVGAAYTPRGLLTTANGGQVTGVAFLGGQMFAVDSDGNLYEVMDYETLGFATIRPQSGNPYFTPLPGAGPSLRLIANVGNANSPFSGLTLGPQNVEGGKYANMLFASDTAGNLHAFDTAGVPQPVFYNNQPTVRAGVGRLTGLAFSPIDYNLWHVTQRRRTDAGHMAEQSHDLVRPDGALNPSGAGMSFYFGLENPRSSDCVAPQPGTQAYVNYGSPNLNTYNVPGVSKGSLTTNTFSLKDLEAGDKPTLYFTYYADTEDSDDYDAFRVYVGTDEGASVVSGDANDISRGEGEWKVVATNTDLRDNVSDQSIRNGGQHLVDGRGGAGWRQARIDLSQFAGQDKLRLRFVFSTAGEMHAGDGTQTGVTVRAVPGTSLHSERSNFSTDATHTYSLDLGYVLQLPAMAGIDIVSNSYFAVNGVEFEFVRPGDTVTSGRTSIWIANADSTAQVANKIATVVNADATFKAGGGRVLVDSVNKNRLQFRNAISMDVGGLGMPSTTSIQLVGAPDGTPNAIPVHFDMSAAEVARAIVERIELVQPGIAKIPGQLAGDVNASEIVIYGNENNITFGAPFVVHRGYPADHPERKGALSERFLGGTDIALRGSQNNAFEGIYIDDIIIGCTERGEMVTGAAADTAFVDRPRVPPYSLTPVTVTPILNTPDDPQPIMVGSYELTIRRGADYGLFVHTAQAGGTSTSRLVTYNAFDTNDRLTSGVSFLVPSAAEISAEGLFTISDGTNKRTFQFLDPDAYTPPDVGNIPIYLQRGADAGRVARAVANAINGVKGWKVTASLSNVASPAYPFGTNRIDLAGAISMSAPDFMGVRVSPALPGPADANQPPAQGQILVEANQITYSQNNGIYAGPGTRDGGGLAHPGSPLPLRVPNSEGLVPGLTIMNNVIAGAANAAISFSGEANAYGASTPATPFGRIVNNTLVGNVSNASGVGVDVGVNASPTLLNNIVAGFNTGIRIDWSSRSTVVGTTLYQGNTMNTNTGDLGSFPIQLSTTDPLFVSPATGNYYLKAGSQAIDSSLDTLGDRAAMITVRRPLGIPDSPILAPERDVYGQYRVDDPRVSPPTGLGANVFRDRGAIDRVDWTGPLGRLIDPMDNDGLGFDRDPLVDEVRTAGAAPTKFTIALEDGNGIGIDDATVLPSEITVLRNGVLLKLDVDYTISYQATNKTIDILPMSGVWAPNSTYTIFLSSKICDIAGNSIRPNQTDGTTRFRITLSGMDYGDAPDPRYPSLNAGNGARHIIDSNFCLGAVVSSERDARQTPDASGDDGDDGVDFPVDLKVGAAGTVVVTHYDARATFDGLGNPTADSGKVDAWIDFNGDGDWDDAGEQILVSQSVRVGRNSTSGESRFTFNVPAGIDLGTENSGFRMARFRLSRAGGLSPRGEAPDGEVEDYRVRIVKEYEDYGDAPLPYPTLQTGNGAVHLVPTDATGKPMLYLGAGVTYDHDGRPEQRANGDIDDGVVFDNAQPLSQGALAHAVVNVSNALPSGATAYLNAWIDFNIDGDWSDAGDAIVFCNADGTPLLGPGGVSITRLPMQSGANDVWFRVPADAKKDYTFARFRLSTDVAAASPTGAAADGEVEDYRVLVMDAPMDFGDAPDSATTPGYPTLSANGGARHRVDAAFHLGPTISYELDGQPTANADGDFGDDGVVFQAPLQVPGMPGAIIPGELTTLTVDIRGRVNSEGKLIDAAGNAAPAYLNAWVDFNGDRSWSGLSEQIFRDLSFDTPGVKTLTFRAPLNLTTKDTFARFRLSQVAGLASTGPNAGATAENIPVGEVEDYKVSITTGTGTISGRVFLDANADNRLDVANEATLSGVTVYLDLNNNNAIDPGEPTTVSMSDDPATLTVDETGNYVFRGLFPRSYVVRQVTPDGCLQTYVGAIGSIAAPIGLNLTDGQTFSLASGGRTVVFEFDTSSSPGVGMGRVAVPFRAADSAATVAQSIASAVNSAAAGFARLTATTIGNTVVLSGDRAATFDRGTSPLGNTPWTYTFDVAAGQTMANVNFGLVVRPTVSVGDAYVVEGNSGSKFVNVDVTVKGAFQAPFIVNYATSDGVVSGRAATTADLDYTATAGPLVFTPRNQAVMRWDLKQLTKNATNDYSASGDGTRIVWEGRSAAGWDLFLYDEATGETVQVTDGTTNNRYAKIRGNYVVWAAQANDNQPTEIYLYDIAAKKTRRITNNATEDTLPQLSGDLVVWCGTANGHRAIFSYDLKNPAAAPVRISSGTADCSDPQVSGRSVVWSAGAAAGSDLFLYDGTSGTTTRINSSDPFNRRARIDGSRVVWESATAMTSRVMCYDAVAGTTTQLSSAGVSASAPQISGDGVVWVEAAGDFSDVYYANVAVAGSTRRLSSGREMSAAPQICGNRVAWESSAVSYYYYGGVYASDWEVVYYEIGGKAAPANISNRPFADRGIILSDSMVVWRGESLNGVELIRAKQVLSEAKLTISIPVSGDLRLENDEQFYLDLLDSDLAILESGKSRAVITILNDDGVMDYGNADPLNYPTLLVDNGARHLLETSLRLGTAAVAEDGVTIASNPTDNDGVVLPAALVGGTSAEVAVTATGAGKIDAWIDFNGDGDWDDIGEQIFVGASVSAGVNRLKFDVPVRGFVPGAAAARFRLSSEGGLAPTGFAMDGEVEDYVVNLADNIRLDNRTLYVGGTDMDDVFSFWAGSLYIVRVTNQYCDRVYKYDPLQIDTIVFDGRGGVDSANFYGTTDRETVVFNAVPTPDAATGLALSSVFAGARFTVKTTNTERGYAFGNGGNDEASFLGLGADDVFRADAIAVTASAVPQYPLPDAVYQGASTDGFAVVNAVASARGAVGFLRDSLGDDTLTSSTVGGVSRVALSSPLFRHTLTGFDGVDVTASQGYDVLQWSDSAGNDTFTDRPVLGPDRRPTSRRAVSLRNAAYNVSATGFDKAEVTATAGGRDVALLYDSIGDDLVRMYPDYTTIVGTGLDTRVTGFGTVRAYSKNGGADQAKLYDSADADNVIASRALVKLSSGVSRERSAETFRSVEVFSTSANDTARLYDTALKDTFVAKPTTCLLTDGLYAEATDSAAGGTYSIRLNNFRSVTAVSCLGGGDAAFLYGSAEADTMVGSLAYGVSPSSVSMSSKVNPYSNQAVGFESVRGISGQGSPAGTFDVAYLYDSSGNDRFDALATLATMTGGGTTIEAALFRYVAGYSTAGNDEAVLMGTPGDDRFTANAASTSKITRPNGEILDPAAPTYVSLSNGVSYDLAARGFRNVMSSGGGGTNDIATLVDSAVNDLLTAQGPTARLESVDPTALYAISVDHYQRVTAKSVSGGVDKKKVTDPLDFVLDTSTGDWLIEP